VIRKKISDNSVCFPVSLKEGTKYKVSPLGQLRETPEARLSLLEIMEDRHGRGSTVISSQFPVKSWHEIIGEPTIADAICDRIIHSAYRIELKGESVRKKYAKKLT